MAKYVSIKERLKKLTDTAQSEYVSITERKKRNAAGASENIAEKLKTTFVSAPDVIKNINKAAGITEKPISTTESKKTTEQPEPDTQQKSALLKTLTTPILSQITKKPADTAKESTLPAETIKKLKTEPLSVTSAIENVSKGTAAKKQATEKPDFSLESKSPTGLVEFLASPASAKNIVDWTEKNIVAGAGVFNKGVMGLLSALGGEKVPLVKDVIKYYKNDSQIAIEAANKVNKSGASKFLGESVQSTVAMLPSFVLTIMSGGAAAPLLSATAPTIGELSTLPRFSKILYEVAETAKIKPDMIPMFITSFGGAYEEARQEGANWGQAVTRALFEAYPETIIEQSGGFQTLIPGLKSGEAAAKGLTKETLKSIFEEMGEEVQQSIFEGLSKKATYKPGVPYFGVGETEAVVNPTQMAKAAAQAGLVAGALGGAAALSTDTQPQSAGKTIQPQPTTAEQQLQQEITTPKTDTEKLAEEIRKETKLKLKSPKATTPNIQTPTSQTATAKPVQKPALEVKKPAETPAPQLIEKTAQPETATKLTSGDILEPWEMDYVLQRLTPEKLKTYLEQGQNVNRDMLNTDELEKVYDDFVAKKQNITKPIKTANTLQTAKTTSKKLTLKKPEVQKASVQTPTLVTPKAETKNEIKEPVRRSDIEKLVSDTLDIPVAEGRFRQKALGIFKVKPEVIRLKKTKDPDTLFHEVGHFFDKQLDLTGTQHNDELLKLGINATKSESPSERIMEGAAEFVRYYVLDPEQAKKIAPNFYKAFEEKINSNKDYVDLMETVRTAMDNYMKQSPEMRILSNISVGKKAKKIGLNPERLYTLSIDELAPLKRVVEQMTGGEEIKTSDNPFELAWLYRGWQGKAETFLNHGSINENYEKTGKSFKEILKPVNNKLDEFRAYAVAKRAAELKQRGIETGLNADDVNFVLEKNADNTVFENVLTELVKFQNDVLNQLVETGMISEESAAAMKKLNENYVPFNRVFESLEKGTGKSFQTYQPIKGIKGSFKDIVDPLESIIKNTYVITNMAERNRVGKALAELSEKYEGNGKFIDKVPPDMVPQTFTLDEIKKALTEAGADTEVINLEKAATIFRPQMIKGKDNIITVYWNGKPEYYQVFDDSLYRTFMALDKETTSTLVKLMSFPAKFLRTGATLTPEFIGRNPIRDTFTAAVYSRYGFVPAIDTIRGLFHVLKRDDLYTKLMSAGALQSNMVSMDRDYLQKNLRQLLKTKLKDKTLNIVKHPLEILRALSELMEEGTRIGEGVKGMAKETLQEKGQINIADNVLAYFAPEAVIKKYGTSAEVLRKSSLASRDVTLDFARAGTAGKQINKAVAFFNTALQGGDKMVRAFLPEKKTVNGKTTLDFSKTIKTTAKALLTITLPSILLYYKNKDDERYQELPQWQKDLFWIILTKNNIYRIPKPFELGVLFGSIPERIMQWAETQDKNAFDGLDETIKEAMLPNILPTVFLPPVEAMANYSFFTGQSIVPESEKRLQAPEQYGQYTSETSKLLGKFFNYSPRKIENILKGYGGGLASYGTQLTDKLIKLAGASEEKVLPAKDITQQPLLKGFTAKEFVSSKSVNDIYNKLEKLEAEYNTAKSKGEINSIDEYDKKEELVKLRSVTEQLSELRSRTKDIYKNNNMTPDEKRKSIDQINMAMAAVARTGMGRDATKLKSSITIINKEFFDNYGDTAGAKMLLDVFNNTNESNYFPKLASSKIRIFSQDVYLNKNQVQDMQDYMNKAASKNLDNLTKNEGFNKLNDDEKIKAILDINQEIYDMAKEYIARKMGIKKQQTLTNPIPKFKAVKP